MFLTQKVYVKFDDIEQVRSFINTIDKIDANFSLGRENYMVDAKSILGVFTLDLNTPQILTCDSDDTGILERLSPFLTTEDNKTCR